MKRNIESLKYMGSKYFRDNLFKPIEEKIEVEYNENHLQIGTCIEDGSIYTIDLRDGIKLLIAGLSGSGKTFALRAVIDRLNKIDKSIIILSDVKNEMRSSRHPVQYEFQHGLLPGEEAEGMRVVTFRPTFFRKVNPELPPQNYWMSLDMKDMSENDFGALMNLGNIRSEPQKIALQEVYKQIKKAYKDDPNFEFTQDWLEDVVMNIDDITTATKNTIKFRFRPLFDSKMFSHRNRRDLVRAMQKGYVPSINMDGFNLFSKKSSLNYPLATLSMLHSLLVEARKKKKIKPLWIVLEEMTRFVNNKDDSTFKQEVIESYGLNRKFNINYIAVPQLIEDCPVEIMKQSNYLFIPASADINTIRQILMTSGMTKNMQTATNESITLKNKLKKYKYSWIAVSRNDGTRKLIKFLSPLSKHMKVDT